MAKQEKATMSVKELAQYLGIGENQAYNYLLQGRIPAHRLGARWVISRAQIKNWLENASAMPVGERC